MFRWAHLIAGIMWVGNSMLFNWLDRNLEKHHAELSRLSQGKIFMVHSGAFYDVEKKLLEPGEMPATLHWFKWQNFTTWATGISLFVLVYYMHGASVRSSIRASTTSTPAVAITLSVSALFTGWLDLRRAVAHGRRAQPAARDDRLDRAAVRRDLRVRAGVQRPRRVHADRRADRHADDRQRVDGDRAVAARADRRDHGRAREQDPTLSIRAKQRSIHNNYLTFPLLFIMLSNHFGSATSHAAQLADPDPRDDRRRGHPSLHEHPLPRRRPGAARWRRGSRRRSPRARSRSRG